MSLERVTKRAGVGKVGLYRLGSSKPEMAGDLLTHVCLMITETGDMGSLGADLEAVLMAIRRVVRHRVSRNILTDLHYELEHEPALAKAIRPFQKARRDRAHDLIERAVARGKLSNHVDPETIADPVAARSTGASLWSAAVRTVRMSAAWSL